MPEKQSTQSILPSLPLTPRISISSNLPQPITQTTHSSNNQSITQKVYLLERELEIIKVKQLCFGRVPLKEIDEFLEKVQNVKNEYIAEKESH